MNCLSGTFFLFVNVGAEWVQIVPQMKGTAAVSDKEPLLAWHFLFVINLSRACARNDRMHGLGKRACAARDLHTVFVSLADFEGMMTCLGFKHNTTQLLCVSHVTFLWWWWHRGGGGWF
jgi:hypothetical protein